MKVGRNDAVAALVILAVCTGIGYLAGAPLFGMIVGLILALVLVAL